MKRNDIYLFIETYKNNIAIPFPSLKDLDNYTVNFSGLGELLGTFDRIFDIDIRNMEVQNVYISYRYLDSKNENYNYLQLPIKYRDDNYNEKGLKHSFISYLQGDYERLRLFDIRYMPKIRQYFSDKGTLNDRDIELAVNSYFKDNSYKKRRDVYFKLVNAGEKVKIDNYREKKFSGNDNLFQFDVRNDYFNSLVSYARLGKEEYARVMEEISSFGLEELSEKMRHPYFSVVDGAGDANQVLLSDIWALECATRMNLDDIKSLFIIDKGKKKR